MCCFSGEMTRVANTRIFARLVEPTRQLLVYQMEYAASGSVAMILPIPIAPGTQEVEFVSLEDEPTFFDKLDALFPAPKLYRGAPQSAPAPANLRVEVVGSFVASFVPSQADFSRLDPRFRISPSVWARLPVYADYGFVAFQLREPAARPHPMAFTFPTRMPGQLFFPTIHVHDGALHPRGDFDHQLYLQGTATGLETSAYEAGPLPGVDPAAHVHRTRLRGSLPNRDTVIPLGDGPSPPVAEVPGGLRALLARVFGG